MPVSKKDALNRRKSIAVTGQLKPVVVPKGRRRAHSIVPGDHLSPLAKLRRSLAPRKSILKAPINFSADDGPVSSQSSSQPLPQSQNSVFDESSADYSVTDVTQEFRTRTHNTSRKSLGRRVSFAEHAHVRLFQKNKQGDTNSPHTQESSAPENFESQHSPLQAVTDENAYPSSMSRRRRSSMRQSMAGSQDMDLTAVAVSVLSRPDEDDGDDDDDEYDDDMDVTDVINGDFLRKRSLSLGIRQPLSQIHNADSSHNVDDTISSTVDDSQDMSDMSGHSEAMEFTIPLNQSLRRPAHEDEAWLALRQATHSGDTSYELESPSGDERNKDGANMDLDDAMQRLMRGRVSLPPEAQPLDNMDDSMSSNNDSFDNSFDNAGDENRTINLSKVGGQFTLDEPSIVNTSLDYAESAMDESEVYGTIVSPVQSTVRPTLARSDPPAMGLQITKSTAVFQPPLLNSSSLKDHDGSAVPADNTNIPILFTFTPQPSLPVKNPSTRVSPSKSKGKATFSAAFAPPVTRPSPRKSTVSGTPQSTKRPRLLSDDGNDAEDLNIDKPSPMKRQNLAEKWKGSITEASPVNRSVSPPPIKPMPQLLSPSKIAPFQATGTSATSRPVSALRRPSGYFARRKSLGVGLGNQSQTQKDLSSSNINATSMTSVRISPKKKAGLSLGRASMGSAPASAWSRPEKNRTSNAMAMTSNAKAKRQETLLATTSVSSPRQKSPSPTPAPAASTDTHSPLSPASPIQVIEQPDLSNILETRKRGEDELDIDMEVNSSEQWRENIQQVNYEEDTPVISVEQFFSITGIKFMDELTAPRRSMHQPSRQPRSPEDIQMAEYVNAIGIDIPQLVLYSRVSKDLQAWMEKSKEVFLQVEEEASKVTPELFVEYSRADEEGQAELLHQLNLIRTNTRGLAKSDWYEWKLQWVEGLRIPADKSFNDLETDAKALESLRVAANELVPSLEKQYQELVAELEKEQAEVAEIEASDQGYLNELKISIAEQNIEVEALQADVAEGSDKLRWLEERVQEIEAQKLEAKTAIADAQRLLQIQSNSTRSEVFRLKDELEALEDLHMFHATKIDTNVFEFVYASQFCVHVPCQNFIPIVSKVDISRTDKHRTKYKDDFPRLSEWLLLTAKQLIADEANLSARQIVHRLGDYWSSCTQLRSQLNLLSIKYPVNINIATQKDNFMPSFVARAMILFPSVKAKAFVSFTFTAEMVSQWPLSVGSLDCEVDIAYGPIDRSTILKVLMDRLSQASPSDNYACLLDACIEAQDIYA